LNVKIKCSSDGKLFCNVIKSNLVDANMCGYKDL
jgi:hypothetical protein